MNKIILATSNSGKITELKLMLPEFDCIPQKELAINDAEESGSTFIENAILKARHACRLGSLPALADDSGLVVNALQGQPGIYSARFAGQHTSDMDNMNKLLEKLEGIPDSERQAYYYCAIVILSHENDPMPIIATGQWKGRILTEPQGYQGFGYDPIFYVDKRQCTAAQLSLELKNTLSHRAKALSELKIKLNEKT